MRRRGFRWRHLVVCFLLSLAVTGCGSVTREDEDGKNQEENTYRIYYTNADRTALVGHDFRPRSEDFDGILEEVVNAFRHADAQDVKSALPENVTINSTSTGINEIDVDFNAEYLSLDPITELLLRSAVVKTLLSLKGVDSVRFTVESQALVIGEEEVGPMTADTFIVPEGKGINSYRNAMLTLYFPSGDGNQLSGISKKVYYSSNLNKERVVIEKMLSGPGEEGLLPVAVEGTLVQDVSVSNGYCIVDFSEEINSAPTGDVIANPETVLYAFTNAIIDSCSEDNVIGVRFRIGGSSDVRFRDQVRLDQVFSRNAELIYNPVVKLEESEKSS